MTVGDGRRVGSGGVSTAGGRSRTGALTTTLRTSARGPPSPGRARSRGDAADRERAARAIPSPPPAGTPPRRRAGAAPPSAARRGRRPGRRGRRSPRRSRDVPASGGGSRPARRTRFPAHPPRFPPLRAPNGRAPPRPPPRRRRRSGWPARSPPSSAPLRPGLLRVELVRLDDVLDELVPDDVLVREADECDPVDRAQNVLHLNEP